MKHINCASLVVATLGLFAPLGHVHAVVVPHAWVDGGATGPGSGDAIVVDFGDNAPGLLMDDMAFNNSGFFGGAASASASTANTGPAPMVNLSGDSTLAFENAVFAHAEILDAYVFGDSANPAAASGSVFVDISYTYTESFKSPDFGATDFGIQVRLPPGIITPICGGSQALGSQTLSCDLGTLLFGVPVDLELDLDLSASVGGVADAFASFSFRAFDPTVLLTVESAGGFVQGPTSTVPEPPASLLALFGMVALWLRASRGRSSRRLHST